MVSPQCGCGREGAFAAHSLAFRGAAEPKRLAEVVELHLAALQPPSTVYTKSLEHTRHKTFGVCAQQHICMNTHTPLYNTV